MAPRSAAANVGFNPAAPVIAADHPVRRPLCSFDQRVGACCRLDARAGKRILQFAIGRRIADSREAGSELARQSGKRCGLADSRSPLRRDSVSVRV